ncbi:MAG TPA: hypothetical protein PLJ21_01960 [Pseudobdellovibrionaceae bacterium]|nr:hypothetical protein [Pseudobdellovibrionaceae bacterium]
MKFLYLFAVLQLLYTVEAKAQSSDAHFSAWVERHASPSIVEAHNKSTISKVSPTDIESALSGHLRRTFREWIETRYYLSIINSERHQTILKVIADRVTKSAPNEVVIAFVGAQHAIELAFSGVIADQRTLYTFPQISAKTTLVGSYAEYERELIKFKTPENSDKVEALLQFLRRENHGVIGAQASEMLKTSFRLTARHYGRTRASVRTLDVSTNEEGAMPRLIVFADAHAVQSLQHIKTFPVQSLVAAGVKKVTFLVEPFGREEDISIDDIQRHATLGGQLATDNDDFRRAIDEISPKLLRQLEASSSIILPSTMEIAKLSVAIAEAGLKVDYKGVEVDSSFRVQRSQTKSCESLFSSSK